MGTGRKVDSLLSDSWDCLWQNDWISKKGKGARYRRSGRQQIMPNVNFSSYVFLFVPADLDWLLKPLLWPCEECSWRSALGTYLYLFYSCPQSIHWITGSDLKLRALRGYWLQQVSGGSNVPHVFIVDVENNQSYTDKAHCSLKVVINNVPAPLKGIDHWLGGCAVTVEELL